MSLINTQNEFIWYQKYRPSKIEDCIAPDEIKNIFKGIVESGKIPSMLLSGDAGMGKTTLALAMCNELNANVLFLNAASEDNGIDTFRTTIRQFASTAAMFDESQKVIILDEADGLTNSAMLAAKGIVEEFSGSCSFILTCNLKAKIIEPLHSRCMHVDFKIDKADRPEMAKQFFKRMCWMLGNEGIKFSKPSVAELVSKHFPDFRRVINELQRYSISGSIDSGVLIDNLEDFVAKTFELMKGKKFGELRKLLMENIDIDDKRMYRMLYDKAHDYLEPSSMPEWVITIGEYLYKSAFVADKEINTMACLTELMVAAKFK